MSIFDNTTVAFQSKSNRDLQKSRLLFTMISNPTLVKSGKFFTELAFALHLPVKSFIKATIFKQFVGGENIDECKITINNLGKYGIGSILDYSVEGKTDDDGFDKTCEEIIKTIEEAKNNPMIPFSVFKVSGMGSIKILEKASGGDLNPMESEQFQKIKQRVSKICSAAAAANVRVFIDAEESWIQNPIDEMAEEMMENFNKNKVIVYNTVQMYRHDRLDYIHHLHERAKNKNYKVGLKIVRGAYMEKEAKRAIEQGYQNPIQPDKSSTDKDYNQALEYCIEHIEDFAICAGTHNEASSELLISLMKQKGLENHDNRVYFSQLLGMSDHISYNLANLGYNVAKYVPYGPVREVMPYLIRRAQENTSVKGQTGRELSLIKKEINLRKTLNNS
jgi:proline dehydrogenase